jgi:hypothetical protein
MLAWPPGHTGRRPPGRGVLEIITLTLKSGGKMNEENVQEYSLTFSCSQLFYAAVIKSSSNRQMEFFSDRSETLDFRLGSF